MATCKQRGGRCPCQRGGDEAPPFLTNAIELTKAVVNGPKATGPGAPDLGQLKQSANSYFKGGYRATERDKFYLRKYKRGESIGFTMKASLKSKGLLPRNSKTMRGKKVLGAKYK
jgi:hypothetical protein